VSGNPACEILLHLSTEDSRRRGYSRAFRVFGVSQIWTKWGSELRDTPGPNGRRIRWVREKVQRRSCERSSTLHQISGGRFIFGAGSGLWKSEFVELGDAVR